MCTKRLSADVLFQQSVFSAKTVRCAESVLEVTLLRSGLLQLPSYRASLYRDCMLDAIWLILLLFHIIYLR